MSYICCSKHILLDVRIYLISYISDGIKTIVVISQYAFTTVYGRNLIANMLNSYTNMLNRSHCIIKFEQEAKGHTPLLSTIFP